jgi:hypothetical protein
MIFNIVNPSDACTLESDDLAAAGAACTLLGEGRYALRELGGDAEVPLFLFAKLDRIDAWFREHGGENLNGVLSTKLPAIARALESVKLGTPDRRDVERSSLNDIMGRAHELARQLRKRLPRVDEGDRV